MKLAPLTKLILAFALSIWAFPLKTALSLEILLAAQILITFLLGALPRSAPGFMGILFGVVFIFLIQYFFGGGVGAATITSLKMLTMTVPFIMLVAATPIQDLSAALVRQCRVAPEYAFLLTSILRFIPDFIEEGKAIRQAQACRGFTAKRNLFLYIQSFLAVVEPLVLGAVGRAETMAISLEMRGFGDGKGPVNRNLSIGAIDFLVFLMMIGTTAILFSPQLLSKVIAFF